MESLLTVFRNIKNPALLLRNDIYDQLKSLSKRFAGTNFNDEMLHDINVASKPGDSLEVLKECVQVVWRTQ